jgi:hypothetical protein
MAINNTNLQQLRIVPQPTHHEQQLQMMPQQLTPTVAYIVGEEGKIDDR